VLPIQKSIGNRLGESWVYHSLGQLAVYENQLSQARAYATEAWQIHRDLNFRKGQAITLNLLGYICLTMADYVAAKEYYLAGLQISREIGYRKGEALLLAALGLLHNQTDDDVVAYDYSQKSLALMPKLRQPTSQGHALTNLGHALAGLGRLSEATSVYQQAVNLRRETGEKHLLLDSLAGLAHVLWQQKALRKALAHVEEILAEEHAPHLRGSHQPLRIYMTCCRILTAHEDERAEQVLKLAYDLWQQRADSIEDEESHRFFVENVPLHQEIARQFNQL
jgi:tetratricopeptide (TPR) repeat protein